MNQISQSQVQGFPSTSVPPAGDVKRRADDAHGGLASLAGATDQPILNAPPAVHAYARQADMVVRARRGADTPPTSVELKGQRDVFTDTSNKSHRIEVTGPRPTITLGGGNNQISLKDIALTKLQAGDGNNTVDSKDILARVNLGNGDNRYTGSADFLTLGNGNNVVSGDIKNIFRVGNGNNQLTGSFPSMDIGNGNNHIRLTGRAGQITLGTGANTIDAGAKNDTMLWLASKGGDTRVTNLTQPLDFQFSGSAAPGNVSVSRVGNDLIAARSGSTEKLTVAGYYGLAKPPIVSMHAGGSTYSVAGIDTMGSTWSRS